MGYKPDLSDLGAPNSVNRVRHLRLGVGEKITAPDGKESEPSKPLDVFPSQRRIKERSDVSGQPRAGNIFGNGAGAM
jgi:hypothetical protein